jgi:Rrf2 family protein
MDIIRRNTDYALRAMVELADRFGNGPVATKELSDRQNIPYQLACKLLQRLNKARIVKSTMGPAGGFVLSSNPSKITVRQVVEAVQGPVRLNRCLLDKKLCPLSRNCTINPELDRLQKNIDVFLERLTLKQLSSPKTNNRRRRKK